MKYVAGVMVLMVSCMLGIAGYAEDASQADAPMVCTMNAEGTSSCPMPAEMKKEMMGKCMMPQMRTGKMKVTATTDGGIVVVSGDELIKYDAGLNEIKRVTVGKGVVCPPMEGSSMTAPEAKKMEMDHPVAETPVQPAQTTQS